MPPQPAPEQPQKRLGHSVGDTFTLPRYEGTGADRKISGEHTFTVSEHDGPSATVTSDQGGEYKMSKDAVKHFSDDLNQRVDVPEHPSHAGINAVRDGSAQFLGKGDDGLVFDTGDGQVAKVTTSVPFNLSYFREHRHAIADARQQAELTNQAIADGHDLLVPQQFIEHGEKGFTTMPRLDLDAKLSREQITAYRDKMKAFHAAGWDVGDQVQTGVDDQGNIRIYDTGKLHRVDMNTPRGHTGDDDPSGMLNHAGGLLRDHGHYDDEEQDREFRLLLQQFEWAATKAEYSQHLPKEATDLGLTLETMIQNDHDAASFVIDDVREVLGKIPDSEHKQEIATLVDFWESNKTNEIMDARMLDAQAKFADLVTEYEGIDEDDEPHSESLDSHITDRDLFAAMVPDLSNDSLALVAFHAMNSGHGEKFNLAGFEIDPSAFAASNPYAESLLTILREQEDQGYDGFGGEAEPGKETLSPIEIDYSDGEPKFIGPTGHHFGMFANDETAEAAAKLIGSGVYVKYKYDHPAITISGTPTPNQLEAISSLISESRTDLADIRMLDDDGNEINNEQMEGENGNDLHGTDVASAIMQAYSQIVLTGPERTKNLKTWLGESKLLDSNGSPIILYHGTARPDKVGDRFRKEKATSGPMPYFTNSPELGSNYAVNKPYRGDEDIDLYDAFTLDGMSLTDAWNNMPNSEREAFIENLPKVQRKDAGKTWKYELGDDAPVGADHLDYQANQGNIRDTGRKTRGNYLAAAYNAWVGGGMVHPDTEELRDVFEAAGIPKHRTKFNDPYAEFSGVFPVFIRMENPLNTHDVPREMADAIDERAEIEAETWQGNEFSGVDSWDKSAKEPLEWAKLFRLAVTSTKYKNDNSFIWTSIPDWATDVFSGLGYDGIVDTGNKKGLGLDHLVYIPFEENQIKSAAGNTGAFSPGDNRITYAADDDAGIDRPATPEPSTPEPSTPKRPVWDKSAGQGQGLQANAETRGKERQEAMADDSPAVHPDHMEPYKHVAPEPLPTPEPDQSARDELSKRWVDAGMGAGDNLDTSGFADVLKRNKGYVDKDPNFFPKPEDNERFKNANIDGLDELQDRAHPKPPQQPTGWENDDYLYHIAKVDDAEQIMAEGLRPNQPTNFADNLKWNIEGNVFLTEKQGVQTWQEHIGEMAESKLESQSRTLAWKLNAAQASLSELVERGPHKNYDAERVEIQKEINKLTKQKEAINGRVQEHERDTTGHTKVFRVPKSKVQDYIAIDEAGTRDAQADAFKLNNYVTDRVKWAKQQTGMADQEISASTKAIKGLSLERKTLKDTANRAERSQILAQEEVQERIKEKERLIREQYPTPGRHETRVIPANLDPETDIHTLQVKDTTAEGDPWVDVVTMPGPASDVLDKWERLYIRGIRLGQQPRWQPQAEEPLDKEFPATEIHWTDEVTNRFDSGEFADGKSIPRVSLSHWYADPETHEEEWIENRVRHADESGLTKLHEVKARIKKFHEDTHDRESSRSTGADVSSVKPIYWDDILDDDPGLFFKKLKGSTDRGTAARANWVETKSEWLDWEELNAASFQSNLTTLAKGQLQNLQLKVASNPNYWRWAKDNHAVDDEGLPLIIFHGTRRGGFDEFGNLDVEGHIYGSTDVATGSTYSGGFTDDVTPVFATDLSDIEHTLNTTEKYSLEVGEDGYKVVKLSRSYNPVRREGPIKSFKPIIEAATEEEFIVAWNRWIAEGKDVLNARGVYPLIYRLTNPLVVEGNGSNWNSIPLFAEHEGWHDGTPESLLGDPMFQAKMNSQLKSSTAPPGTLGSSALGQMYDRALSLGQTGPWKEIENNKAALDTLKEYTGQLHPSQFGDHDVIAKASRIYSDASAQMNPDFLLIETFPIDWAETGTTRDLSEMAEANGHDGIIFKDIIDDGGQGGTDQPYGGLDPADVYVSFTTAQVKSAHNGGNFAEMSPDRNKMMYSATA